MSSVINTTKAEARPAISVFLKRSGSFRNQVSRGDPVSRTAPVRQSVGPISRRWHPSYNGPSHGWRDEACTVVVTQSAMWGGKTRSAAFGISRRREFARGPVHVMTLWRTTAGIDKVETLRPGSSWILACNLRLLRLPVGWSFDQCSSGATMRRPSYIACTLEPTATRCIRVPCRSGRFREPPRRHRQGADKRIATYGASLSKRPLFTSCADDGS